MRLVRGIAGSVLAVVLLAGCAGDPHPASTDTPGDPWHPPSNQVPSAEQPVPQAPPETVTGDLDTTHKPVVQ